MRFALRPPDRPSCEFSGFSSACPLPAARRLRGPVPENVHVGGFAVAREPESSHRGSDFYTNQARDFPDHEKFLANIVCCPPMDVGAEFSRADPQRLRMLPGGRLNRTKGGKAGGLRDGKSASTSLQVCFSAWENILYQVGIAPRKVGESTRILPGFCKFALSLWPRF